MRILLVEDNPVLGEAVVDQLTDDGHATDWAKTLAEAEAIARVTDYNLVLLDLMLPDGQGLDLLKGFRRRGDLSPVIILTAKDQVSDRIAGLNAGADDYLVKPFDLDELSARVSAVARRYHGNPNPLLELGPLQVDLSAHSLFREGKSVELTAREWALFEGLIQRPGHLLTKSQLEDRLYAYGTEIESNTIEVYISRIRKKLGRDSIETVRGMGYRLGYS